MTKRIRFPYQIKFHYSVYESPQKYRLSGDRLYEVILKTEKLYSRVIFTSEQKAKCGVEIDYSREKISRYKIKCATTITIKTKEALPVGIQWYPEDSYSVQESLCDDLTSYVDKYVIHIFEDEKGEVKVEQHKGWYRYNGEFPFNV